MKNLSKRIIEFNRPLLPDMVQLKYKFMAESAFRFFRGSCHLFYEDLHHSRKLHHSPDGWICGDLHLENFGSFKGNNRVVYFDLNDFDEAMLAPVTWDALRLCTSIFVAFTGLGLKTTEAKATATSFLLEYKKILSGGKALYIEPRTANGIVKRFLKTVKKRKESDLLNSIIKKKGNHLAIIIDHLKYFPVEESLKNRLNSHITAWIKDGKALSKHFKVEDLVFRVAGTGSVGLKRYMILLRDKKTVNSYLLLDMKESRPSSLARWNAVKQPAWASEADRVVEIKQRMQNVSPALLGTVLFEGVNYVVQELQPTADKLNLDLLAVNEAETVQVIKDMALLLASAQLRSGGIQHSAIIDSLIAFGKQDDWQVPLLNYAAQYAKQVAKDYRQFIADYKKGVFRDNGTKN